MARSGTFIILLSILALGAPGSARPSDEVAGNAPAGDTIMVVAAVDGVVVYTGRYFAHGDTVELRDGDGRIVHYNHLKRIAPGITPGVSVRAGQPIGEIPADPRAPPRL